MRDGGRIKGADYIDIMVRHVSAILTKEWLCWKRNLVRSLAELLLPFAFMVVLLLTYAKIPKTSVPSGPNYDTHLTITAIRPDNAEKAMNMENAGYSFYVRKIFSFYTNYAIGIAPSSHKLAQQLSDHLYSRAIRHMLFHSEEELLQYAAKPYKVDGRLRNITAGVSFVGDVKRGDYSYKVLVDKVIVADVSENFVDRLLR